MVAVLGTALPYMSDDMLNVAIPSVARDLEASAQLAAVGAATSVPLGVLVPLLVLAVGMATFAAPLAALTMGALTEDDQGVASGLNNAVGQLAGVLAVIILPGLAGLAGAETFTGPAFDAAYPRAMRAAAALAVVGLPLVTLLGNRPEPTPQEVRS